MKWIPANLGAEPKKVAMLAGLVAVAGIVYYINRDSGSSAAPARPATAATTPRPAGTAPAPAPKVPLRSVSRSTARVTQGGTGKGPREFRPSIKVPKDLDPSSVDPTLHLQLLAKLQDVKPEAGTRSLFEILAAPPVDLKVKEPEKIKPVYVASGPQKPVPPPPPQPVVEPAAPKIALKFYGWVNREKAGPRRAFFLDGDEIVIAAEGEVIKKRYKVVRIGVNSALVEDTQFKNNAQQQLALEAELSG